MPAGPSSRADPMAGKLGSGTSAVRDGASRTPRTLHYVWVGGDRKPPLLLARIERWREALPDYEVREWNDRSFDLLSVRYVHQAYVAGAFAFVSDFLRLHALFEEGGVYLDTDVEILRSFDPLLDGITTFGFEIGHAVATSTIIAPAECPAIGALRDAYLSREFIDEEGGQDRTTNVHRTTQFLTRSGLQSVDVEQFVSVAGTTVRVKPAAVFSPYDYLSGIDHRCSETVAVHLFEGTWLSRGQKFRKRTRTMLRSMASRFSRAQR